MDNNERQLDLLVVMLLKDKVDLQVEFELEMVHFVVFQLNKKKPK
jgi:hypothetical protein